MASLGSQGTAGLEADGRISTVPPAIHAPGPRRRGNRLKVTVIAWNVSHNPLGRAYLLADALRNDFDVELVGSIFPPHGYEVWKPLQESRVALKWFRGSEFPAYFNQLEKVAAKIDGDIIIVSKPRLPSYALGILLKATKNRPLILDIDDYELGFFPNRSPARPDPAGKAERDRDFYLPWGRTWTRYCDDLVRCADRITVSNLELQKRYGGVIVHHMRDEDLFDPARFDRDAIRAEFGYGENDRVILFIGTHNVHKGIEHIAKALQTLKNTNYRLCVTGANTALRQRLSGFENAQIDFLPPQSFHDLPRHLCLGDLICLPQSGNSIASRYQMPAKFTDALSMEIPVLGTNVPPLANAAREGLIELLDEQPIHEKIDAIFTNYNNYKECAVRNRNEFLKEYSYAANRPRLIRVIEECLNAPPAVPLEFENLLKLHRRIWR